MTFWPVILDEKIRMNHWLDFQDGHLCWFNMVGECQLPRGFRSMIE